MAKKLKFPLLLKDDYQVRTLDELREHFDLEKVLNYYRNGKLSTWLEDRCYYIEIAGLDAIDERTPNLAQSICEILGVSSEDAKEINLYELTEKQDRLEKLKQYTSDAEMLAHVDQIAFDQEELADSLDEGYDTIYLCGNTFRIPLSLHNKHYVGVGQAKVIVSVDPTYDFTVPNIRFTDIELVNTKGTPFVTVSIKDAEQLYYSAQFQQAAPLLEKLVEMGNNKARCILGEMYICGGANNNGFPKDFNKGYSLICDGANEGDILCLFWKAMHTNDGFKEVYNELFQPLKDEIRTNDALSLYSLASYYEQDGENKNLELATKYYHESAKAGYWRAYQDLGWNYKWGRGVSVDYYKAKEYYLKLAEMGNTWAQIRLGELLFENLDAKEEGLEWYRKGYTPDTLKKDIQKTVENLDSLKHSAYFCYISHNSSHQEFSTKSEAIQTLRKCIIRDCNNINDTFGKKAIEVANSYIKDIESILESMKLYMLICKETGIDYNEEMDHIALSIGEYVNQIIPSYILDYNNCTYTIDSDGKFFDNGFSLAQKRYTLLYHDMDIFGRMYGVNKEAMIDDFSRDLCNYVKTLLQPIKKKLLLINTEVVA